MTLFLKKYSRPQAAYCLCDSEDCYILLVLFLKSLFRPQIFRPPLADFRKTLVHDMVSSKLITSCGVFICPLKFEGRKTTI